MSGPKAPMNWLRVMSILWFPACLAILLPVALHLVFHQATPHGLPLGVVARRATRVVDLVRPTSGDGGAGIFFLVFPLMLAGVVTAIVLRPRATWTIGRRVALVAGVGAVAALAGYIVAVGLHVLPDKPVLIVYAFLLSQVANVSSLAEAPASDRATTDDARRETVKS